MPLNNNNDTNNEIQRDLEALKAVKQLLNDYSQLFQAPRPSNTPKYR